MKEKAMAKPKQSTLKDKCDRALAVIDELDRLTEERKKLFEEHDALVSSLRYEEGIEGHGILLEKTFGKGNTKWGFAPVRELVIRRVPKPEVKKTTRGKRSQPL